MIWRVALAGVVSLALHVLGFAAFVAPDDEAGLIQGGQAGNVAILGNSFADMSTGAPSPVEPDPIDTVEPEVEQAVEVERQPEDVRPETAEIASSSDVVETVQPELNQTTPRTTARQASAETQDTVSPDVAEPVKAASETGVPVDATTTSAPIVPAAPAAPSETTSQSMAEAAKAVQPDEQNNREADEIVQPEPETVTAETETDPAPQASARPETRPERPVRQPARQTTGSGATQDAVRGQSDGREDGQAASSSRSSSSASQGNTQAASNYPGQVFKRLSRVRKPRGLGRGRAVVAFRVSSNGNLAAVSIARSSGNRKIDRAALQHVRRAAPFPSPPRGAQTQFSFSFEGNR